MYSSNPALQRKTSKLPCSKIKVLMFMKNLKLFNYFKVKGNKRVGKWGT